MSDDQQTPAPSRPHQEPHEILEQVDSHWEQLGAALNALDAGAMTAPGLVDDWSGKDLLAHLGRWNEAAHAVITAHLAGRSIAAEYEDFDACNARWAAEDRDLTLAEARARCEASHARLRQLVAGLPSEQWDRLVRGWVRTTCIRHVEMHLPDFEAHAANS